MATKIKPRPWWLFWLGSGRWITISPNIYHPRNISPGDFPALIAHEQTHLVQQGAHRVSWIVRYLLSPSFRLSQEAKAIAVELACYDPSFSEGVLSYYAKDLASSAYLWAAKSEAAARTAINEARASLLGA
jgi:hypothetical protein